MSQEPGSPATIEAGGLRLVVEYRRFGGDRGPAIRVFGEVDGKPVQALRFDCFENDPHYHYDPEGRNFQLHLNPETVPDPLAWSLGELGLNLRSMLRAAGCQELAQRVDPSAVAEALPRVKAALRAQIEASDEQPELAL
jgi:hypothetical protein